MDPKIKSATQENNKEEKEQGKVTDSQEKLSEQSESVNSSNPESRAAEKTETPSPEEQLVCEKDRLLRLSAEFDNYKKRKQREIDEFRKFANESVFRQVLPVVDNLERAIDAAQNNADHVSLLEGVRMTHKEIIKFLEMFNVKPVKADKEPFDPNFHQAVTRQETDEFAENTVVAVLQNGYLLHDRLIRPAMVVVSKRPETSDKKQETDDKGQEEKTE
jgi:molecular chaperone GrpE